MTLKNPRPAVLATAVLATAVLAPTAADAANRADALWAKPDAPRHAEPHADPASGSVDLPGKQTPSDEREGAGEDPAGDGSSRKSLFDPDTSTGTSDLLGHSLAAVLVILVLGAAAVFVVKRLLPRFGISQGRRISVLETVYLGPRKSLYMVQVGDRTLLVTGTRERLGLLADVTGNVPPPEASAPATGGSERASRFRIPEAAPENT